MVPVRSSLRVSSIGLLAAAAALAVVMPQADPLLLKIFRDPDVYIPNLHRALATPSLANLLDPAEENALTAELAALGVAAEHGFYDTRGGAWGSLTLARPLIPGAGNGNTLQWSDLGGKEPQDNAALKAAVWAQFQDFLTAHNAELKVALGELAAPNVSVIDDGAIVQINARRQIGGVTVRDSYVMGFVNRGNLVLYGTRNWGPMNAAAAPTVNAASAEATVAAHLAPFAVQSVLSPTHLEIVPTANTQLLDQDALGAGYDYRLAWVVTVRVVGDLGTWEGLVDATSGALLRFTDTNHYDSVRRVLGGVLPISNDGIVPDGVEQPGYPMPFADILLPDATRTFTTSGGALGCVDGVITTTLSGKFVKMNDVCGPISESSTGDINLAFGPGTDCQVPPGHSAGDTHATRTGFYEVNRLIEQGRGWLPDNTWLAEYQLPVNMNIDDTCNAFWDGGSINFYQSGGGCSNTGELAGVFDHEWGHGLDANDNNTGVSSPGEAIADVHGFLKLNDSCLGRNFQPGVECSGYGDTCSGTPVCTGVRDGDFANHRCGNPHDIRWINQAWDPLGITPCNPVTGTGGGCAGLPGNPPVPSLGPCGREAHCEGYVPAEAGWDVYKRDLQAAPFSYDANTALELATRLAYIGGSFVGNWYQCTGPVGDGCNADSGYKTALAADDDDGDLTNGTPHATAIYNAYNRHQIACAPVPADSGCAGGPTAAPVVSVTGIDQGAILSWPAVPNASEYWVFRTEGVFGCDFGKVKVGEADGLSFTDQGLQNGTTYFYSVLPVGTNTACFGRMSSCASAVPVSGANLLVEETVDFEVITGDADVFLDNCEVGQLTFTAQANGTQPLTNVRVTSLSSPGITFTPAAPFDVAASLPPCGRADATVTFQATDLEFDESIEIEIEFTADEIFPQTRTLTYRVSNVESDFVAQATKTWSFETDLEGWLVSGTFNRENLPGGGTPPTAWHLHSSSTVDSQCDRARSPVVRLSGTSTLSLNAAFATEPTSTIPYDRANVGIIDFDSADQTRTTILPSAGLVYTIPAPAAGGACVTSGEAGWNGTSAGYPAMPDATNQATWTAPSLNPNGGFTGKRTAIDVAYGTDGALALDGFRFDHVTLTDFELQVADAQDDTCIAANLPPIALADAATTPENQPVNIDVLENDSDPDGDPAPADTLTISAIADPPHGTATLDAAGAGTADDTIDYVPDTCFFGTDVFTYTVSDGSLTAEGTVAVDVIGDGGDCFKTVAPCRIYDSRDDEPLTAGTPRDIQIADLCSVPPSVAAVSINITVVVPSANGRLTVYPGTTEPDTSTLNFLAGQNRANNALVGVLGGLLRVNASMAGGGTTHVVIDVNGYTEQVPN